MFCSLGQLVLLLSFTSIGAAQQASLPSVGDQASGLGHLPIILWSVMRSGSTAISRAFAQRADTEVLFEPFIAAYYLGPEREHPRHLDLPPDERYTYEGVWDSLLAPQGGQAVVFAKDFAVALPRRMWDAQRMAKVRHAFLIREPYAAMSSMLKCVMEPDATGYTYFNETEMGYSELLPMFRFVTQDLGQSPIVIDHDDVMASPDAVLHLFTKALGITMDPAMLKWEKPLPASPELWSGFFERANTSTGFHPAGEKKRDTVIIHDPQIAEAAARASDIYEELRSYALRP